MAIAGIACAPWVSERPEGGIAYKRAIGGPGRSSSRERQWTNLNERQQTLSSQTRRFSFTLNGPIEPISSWLKTDAYVSICEGCSTGWTTFCPICRLDVAL